MRILVSGGKTGGHLVPGIALFEELSARGHDCHYMMAATDLKYPIAARVPEERRTLVELTGISRRLSWRTPIFLLKILKAFFQVFGRVRKIKPDAVVITGGYISNPVAMSALLSGIPLYICEQNSVAGVTNRFYARFAKRIFTNFPETRRVPVEKSVVTGSPALFTTKVEKELARRFFGLEASRTVVGITGGSQGARKINDAVMAILPELAKRDIGLAWSAGSVDYERLSANGSVSRIEKEYARVKVFKFIERMDAFYSACDVVVSRAGASVYSEFVHFGIPSLLIPIEKSPDDHQLLNAKFLSDSGAALLLEEKDLTEKSLLEGILQMTANADKWTEGVTALRAKYFTQPPAAKIAGLLEAELAGKNGK